MFVKAINPAFCSMIHHKLKTNKQCKNKQENIVYV